MSKKFQIFLIIVAVFACSTFVVNRVNLGRVTTDSGFDVDYGGGGGWDSGGGGSSWDSGGSSWGSGGSSSSSDDGGGFGFIMFIIIVIIIIVVISSQNKNNTTNNRTYTSNTLPRNFDPGITPGAGKDPETQALLTDAYNIFLRVQEAWMNFDYDQMREYTTDELYNQYHSQLENMKTKGEQNVMKEFTLHSIEVLKKSTKNKIKQYVIDLNVSFKDYIIDKNGRTVRGNQFGQVRMHYKLTFIQNMENLTACPYCGGELENGATVCDYCHSHIPTVSGKMKLSNKEMVSQKK